MLKTAYLKFISFMGLLIILSSCGGSNQNAVDEFFKVNGDNSDDASLVYSTTTFVEGTANDGSIDTNITVTVVGRVFDGTIGEDFVGSKVTVTNLPAGLTMRAIYQNDKEVELQITGNALSHANSDDISNLNVLFETTAFNRADGISGNPGNLGINFKDPYTLAYNTLTLNESGNNDGTIGSSIIVSFPDYVFNGTINEDYIANSKATVSNVPAGLTASVRQTGSNQVTLTLTGTAGSHTNADDITNLGITFLDTAFPGGLTAGGVGLSSRSDIIVNFYNPAVISYSPVSAIFSESGTNIGAIGNQLTITVSEDTFTGSNGDNFVTQGKVNISNIPTGLTASVIKVSDTALAFSLIGNASNHANIDDAANLGLSFNTTAFNFNTNTANVVNSSKTDISIDYDDPYVLSFNTKTFLENGINDGTITTTVNASIVGTTFTGTNGENFVATSKVSVGNVPAGLTVAATRVSTSQVDITITGTATNHASANNIANMVINFNDTAFVSNAAAGVNNSTNSDFAISYLDPVSLSYSGTTFNESGSDDGSISNYLDITVTNDTFTGTNGENFLGNGKATILPSPVTAGLTATLTRQSATVARLQLAGNAAVHNIDITGVTVTFNGTAFTSSSSTANIVNATKNDLVVNFYDSLSYSTTSFNERSANDGGVDETATITLTGTQFTGTNGDNFVADGKAIIANVPVGLTPVLTRDGNYQLTLSFTGTASSHASTNDVSNISVSFLNGAFASGNSGGVANSTISGGSISFLDPVTVSYSGNSFNEAVANDGSISNTIDLTLTGDTFVGSNGQDLIGLGHVTFSPAAPAGLTITLVRNSSTTASLTMTGNAVAHEIDQGPFTLTFAASAFTVNTSTAGIVGASKNDIVVNYNDALSFSTKTFNERAENDGLIGNTVTVSLTGVNFTGSNSDDFVADGKVVLTNVPIGLTPTMIRNSATQLTFSLTGTATTHTTAQDVSNINVIFQNSAFTHNDASSVANYTSTDFVVSFLDPVTVSYSGDTFTEGVVNDGSVSNSLTLTVTNDTLVGSNGDDFVGLGRINVTNVPTGLTAQITRNNATQLTFSLVGNASSNDLDISNITVTFLAAAFTTTTDTTNVTNAVKSDIKINYYDLITYGTKTFTERALNDGAVTQTTTVALTGATYAGNNGDDFVGLGRAIVSNVPSGLTAVLTRNNASQLTLSFTGAATSNESTDSVSNLTVSFLDTAFSGTTAAATQNATVNDIAVNFFDSVALSYSTGTFSEDLANNGSISNTINITVVNDTFTGTNGENYLSNSKASISNLPAGLTATLTKTNATTLSFTLSGNAVDHGDIHDVSNLTLTINPTALTIITDTTNVLNATKNDIVIDYISPSTLVYDSMTLTESSANNGQISSTIDIDISGQDNFTGSISDEFIGQGKVTVTNVPSGLTATVTKTAAKQVRLALTGTAVSHDAADSISNLRVTFNSTAFVFNNDISLVVNYDVTNVNVTYYDTAVLAYSSGGFTEAAENTGGITQTIDIDLTNDTFGGVNGENFLATGKATISNTPSGLTPRVERISNTKVRASFTGNAISHADADDISNLTISFQSSAFSFNTDTSNITNANKNDITVDFNDPYTLGYSAGTFTETAANSGAVNGSVTITLTGTTFTGNNGDNFVATSKVLVSNLPGGLSAVVNRDNANQLTLTLTGSAGAHANVNDISNLTLTFQNTAFTSGAAAGVSGNTKNDFIIDFIDPYSLSYDVTEFDEDVSNVGTIGNSLVITLSGHTFTGVNTDDFVIGGKVSVNNVPAGLTATAIRNSATEIEISLNGTATSHTNSDDIANLRVTFQDTAFSSGALAANVIGYDNTSISVDYLSPYTLSANGFAFDEAGANDGSISDTITYTLVGTTFAGANSRDLVVDGDITINNVPTGLTAVATKQDDNNIVFSFSGNASSHAAVDSISNISVTFLDGAFSSGAAAGVNPNNFTSISVSYDDPPGLTYAPTTFTESTSNIGATGTTISIFAANKNFNGTASEDFVGSSKVSVSGHPAGMTAVVTYVSPTQLNFTLTGNASSHADADDISNGITIAFNDSAFVGGNAAQVVDSTYSSISFDFEDPYQISYSGTTFTESSLNNGSIGTSLSVTLIGTLFNGAASEDYIVSGKATVGNLPAGLTAQVVRLSSTLVQINLTGTATVHANANDISNFTVTFLDGAFTSGAAAGVTNYTRNDLVVDYNDPASLSYASSTFSESVSNIGLSTTTIDITLTNDTFTGPNGENYIATGKISASNSPSGMTPAVTKISDTVVRVSLTGAATNHADANDVSNLGLTFQASAFSFNSDASTITDYSRSNLIIDFIDPYTLAYSATTFTEAAANNGSLDNTSVVTLTGTTFNTTGSDFISDGKVSFSNVPTGLTAVVTRDSGTQVTVSFTGNASSHLNSNDISNMGITFADSAFASGAAAGVSDSNRSDLSVDFNDPPSISYAASTFNEAVSNIGAINTTIDVTLTNDTFTGADSSFYTPGSEVTFTNTPAGLTARAQKIDSTTVRLSFTGNASDHTSVDSISNFTVQFNNAAFTNVAAGNILNSSKADFNINFTNPYSMSFASSTFSEAVSNIGAINTTIDVTVVGTTFTGADSSFYTPSTEVTFTNTPAGLTARAQKINSTTVRLSFSGNASSHANGDDISNFSVAFNDAAFTSGAAAGVANNSKTDFVLDFIDPYSIAYSGGVFDEGSANDGSITTTIDVDLTGTTFTGADSSFYTPGSEVTFANTPGGLTATAQKINSTKVRLAFTGNAAAHANANDIANFSVTFNNLAFTSGASAGVVNSSKTDFVIDFREAASLAYSGGTFSEATANTGSISNTLTITLSNDTFTGSNGENYIGTGKASIANVPAGLTAALNKTSATTVDLVLSGSATTHANANDIANLQLTFAASAFSFNSNAASVTNYDKNDLIIDFLDPYTLAYSVTTFSEAALNDGSIGNTIVLTLTGTTFTTPTVDLITDGDLTVTNIPTGLTAVAVRDSATQVTLSLTGNATNNLDANDISNLTYVFADSAFTSGAAAGVTNSSRTDISVDFEDQPSLSYAGSTFNEAVSNIGAITQTIDVTLVGATFTGTNGAFYTPGSEITFTNTPAGLTARAQKIDPTTVRFSFTGNAGSHTTGDSISNFTAQFNNAAFNVVAAASVGNSVKSDFNITFVNPYIISYASGVFSEDTANIGGVGTTINVTLSGTTFTGVNGAFYTPSTEVTFTNTPAGLTARAQKISDTVVQLSFSGNATSHANADDITNFSVQFNDAAFTSGAAAGVTNNTKSDFAMDFIDPYSVVYSAGTFTEDSNNDGSVTTTVDVDLTGTTYTGTNGAFYTSGVEVTFANTPGGLTARAQKISSTKVRLSFTGTALSHADANDIANFSVTFNNAAFTSGAAAGVTDSAKTDFNIDFVDPASLSYDVVAFDEANANTGSMGNVINITLANDTFTGSNGENFIGTGKAVVANVPSGLTATLNKVNSTTLQFILSGNASSHADANDVSNLTLTFNASSFNFNTDATSVVNYTRADLTVDFVDPYDISYSTGTFAEAAANNGSIGNTIVATLTGTTFTVPGADPITDGDLVVSNVPTGLTAVAVRDSATQVTISLTGNATNNLDANDISNLAVAFQDSAFASGAAAGVDNATKADIIVDFNDQPSLSFGGFTLTEDVANTGTIAGQIDITITGDTFSGSNLDIYTGAKVTFANVPTGLTAQIQKINNTTARLTYTGTATSHAVVNNVSNVNINFLDAAFDNVAAANVSSSSRTDLGVTFRDPYTLSYSGGTFSESAGNDGSISTTIDVDITGTTFTGANGAIYSNGSEVTMVNTPAGLTAQAQKIDPDTVRLSFTGNATSHDNADDISNWGITFNNAAFTSGAAAGVTNTSKLDFIIDYSAPASITYSATTFTESNLNNGAISNTIDIDVVNDTFTGAVSSDLYGNGDITINNVPAGLTVSATKISSTKLRIALAGNASSHGDTDDIANMEITFLASAFTNNTVAANVTGYSRSDLVIDYDDPYVLTYASSTFNEASANDGSIDNAIVVTLTGTTFTGSNGTNYEGTEALVSNLPAGLGATVVKNNSNQVTITLTGSAAAHANANDVSNLTVAFQDSAFASGAAVGVDNSTKSNFVIDFQDLASIAYSAGTFVEGSSNTGTISTQITVTLSNDTFTGGNGDNFAANGKATISNVPTGLTAVLERTSPTTMTLDLNGTASAHANASDISNLTVVFAATAFTFNSNASIVTNSNKNDFVVDFNDPYSLAYSATTLSESAGNDGSIATVINIDLTGTTFTGVNTDNFQGTKVNVTNVPAGLTAQVIRTSGSQVQLSLTGTATNHENSHDVANLTVIFDDTAFASGAASGVTNYSRSDLVIDFVDRPVLAYSTTTFNEATANTGTIGNSIVITLTNELFATGTFDGTKVTTSNVPTGLTASFTRDSDTQLTLNLTGSAGSHASADDLTNVGINFLDTAFQNVAAANITNSSRSDIGINFLDPYQLTYASGAFAEDLANDGSIANTISITLSGTTFTTPAVDMISDGDVTINNVPLGLTAVITRDSGTQVTFSLTGNASSHLNADDIANLEVIFNDSAFVSGAAAGVLNNTKSNFVVDYQDPASIAYSGATFPESVANNGSITTTIDLDVTGDTFTGSNSDNFAGVKATITNTPGGMTAVLTRISSTKLRLSLIGTAAAHANADDISNLTVTLLDNAFTNNATAANVVNYSRSDLSVDFQDPAVIAYSSSTFSEALANNGTISNSLTLTLSGDSFTGSNGENYVATSKVSVGNVPTGLTVVANKTSNTVITLSLTGTAAAHANADDVSNLTITFNDTAFTNNASAANVTGYTRGDLIIDYQDPATLSYSASTFTEDASNNGVTSTAIVITLSGDTFTGSNSDNFVSDSKITPANVPTGLTMVATRDSATQITLTLTGTASNHLNADDIANLTVEFEDTAFTNNSAAANVTNYNRTDLAVDFNDPAVIAYGGGVFVEDVPNDGSIVATVAVTLTGDTFTGTNGENYVGNAKVSVANTPSGLTPVVTKNSATQVTISFTGFASSHVDLDDIANFGITFNATAFTGNTVNTNVTNYQKLDFDIDFNDPYAITYSSTGFIEAPATDDGAMDQPLTVNLAGTTFTGTNGQDFVAASKVTVTNVPAGLTARMVRTGATTLSFYLDGNAAAHNDAADVSNLTVVFDDSAFAMNNASLVADASKNDLEIDFFVTPVNAPTDFTITDSTSTTISMSWTDNSNNEANFTVERCDGFSCDTTWVTAATDSAIAADATTYQATGLSQGTYYRFRVRAENADTESAWLASSMTIAFGGGAITDNGEGTSQEFRDMNCYGVFGTYAVLTWTDIGANNYLIYNDDGGATLVETLSSGTTSYVIDSLDFGNAESWRVVANMGNGVVSPNKTSTDFTTSSTFAPCNVIGNDAGTYHATGATHLYDPRATFIYDGNLFVSDTNNARVLIYNSLPTSKDDVPDVVLGQDIIRDGSSNAVGITNISYNDDDFPPSHSRNDISANMLRCPEGIWVGDVGGSTKVVIADRCTHRVLIWDGIPTTDNAPADIVVGKTNFTSPNSNFPNRSIGLNAPYDVYSDGTRLAIADSNNHRIVIHNTFPTSNGKPWDVCLGAADCDSAGSTGQNATSIQNPRSVLIAGGQLLASSAADDRVMIWSDVTTLSNNEAADYAIGQTSLTASGTGNTATRLRDPWGLSYDGTNDRLYVVDQYNCRVMVYEGIPAASGVAADYALGETDALTTRRCNYSATRFHSISDMAVDEGTGQAFFTNYGQDTLDAITSIPTTLAAGITKAFQINTDDPTLGVPNYGSEDTNGTKNRFMGVTMDTVTGQFFASDDRCDRVLVWNSAPTLPNEHPDYVLGNASFTSCEKAGRAQNRFQDPRGMCIAWNKLFIADYNNRRMMVYNLPIAANQPGADYVLGQTNFTSEPNNGKYYLDRPANCFYDSVADKLLITSENDDVVLVYEGEPTMDSNLANHAADYIIGDFENAGRTQTRINNPRGVVADGTHVYVADSSNRRIMRFPYPSSDTPNADAVLGQTNYTNADTDTGDAAVRQPTGLFIANNKLYTADRDFNRIIYWPLPLTQEFYQSSAGLYGHEGDYDYVGQYESSELQEGDMWDIATDGKRIFGVDLLGGRIIITPLREN